MISINLPNASPYASENQQALRANCGILLHRPRRRGPILGMTYFSMRGPATGL